MDRGAFLPIASALLALLATGAGAQEAAAPGVALPTIDVIATTPLSGSGVDVDKVPAAVTTIGSREIAEEKSPNVVNALDARTASVDVQSVSGNAFQPDVYFRGFDASPVAGTPQGLAVYQNGVRINEAFGDVVNWDLIPTVAIRSVDVVSANPVFGLNALGGAISMKMKDGFGYQGASIDVMGGSYGRGSDLSAMGPASRQLGHLHRGRRRDRQRLPATVGLDDPAHLRRYRLQGRGGRTASQRRAAPAMNSAPPRPRPSNCCSRTGAAYTPGRRRRQNQVAYVNATANVNLSPTWSLQANAYLRDFFQRTVDGNATNAAPCALNSALLCYPSVSNPNAPANGLSGTQLANPFSSTATPGEIDRTSTHTTSMGTTVQATNIDKLFGLNNHFTGGASFDYGVTNFGASAELGPILPNFNVAGSGVFLGPSGDPGQRRPGFAEGDECLYRSLRHRYARPHRGARRHGGRAAQCRRYPPAGSARHGAQRPRRVHAFQPDARRDVQDRRRRHRLRQLFPIQSRADAARARLRRPRAPLRARKLPRFRPAVEAGRCADL